MTSYEHTRRGYDIRVEERFKGPKRSKKADSLNKKNVTAQHNKDDKDHQEAVIDTKIMMDTTFDKTLYEQQTLAWAERMKEEKDAREAMLREQEQERYYWGVEKGMTDAEKDYHDTKVYALNTDFIQTW